jgi:hypothetical protein
MFLLMVVDYIDRQVVVSMFPPQGSVEPSDSHGGLVSIVSITGALGACLCRCLLTGGAASRAYS